MTSEKQVQKLYTDDVTIQIRVVLLIGRATRGICFSQSEGLPKGSPVWVFLHCFLRCHFGGETSGGIANVGCFLRLVTGLKILLHIHIIVNLPPSSFQNV